VHVSQLEPARASASKPKLAPGDRVEVRVLKVDLEKKQVSFSMKPRPERRPAAARKPTRERPKPEPRVAADHPRPAADKPAPRVRPRQPQRPGDRAPGRERPAPPAGRPTNAKPAAPRKPPEARRPAFNNPFAVLAGLKKNDKG
jgi:hypothetical protein